MAFSISLNPETKHKQKESPLMNFYEEPKIVPRQVLSADDLYDNNSGTIMCFKQKDYIILACDTRHSSQMGINSRKMVKSFQFKDFLFSGIGFYPDFNEVYFRLKYESELYENENERPIKLSEIVHVLMNILYSRRSWLIYYLFPVIIGKNAEDELTIYSSDCVGSYEVKKCVCFGSSQAIIQPLLDSIIMKYNQENKNDQELDLEDGIELVQKAFFAAAERDVNTGDYLQIFVYKKDGITEQLIDLRKD